MAEMSKKEIKKFLMQGTLTGKLATVKTDGNPHVVPIWFTLDDTVVKSQGANRIDALQKQIKWIEDHSYKADANIKELKQNLQSC